MQITNDKYKKALAEIEKVVYGKIKHLNNQARILHIGEILSKVICDGKFIEEMDDDEMTSPTLGSQPVHNETNLNALYKEFYEIYCKADYYYIKIDEISEKIEEQKKQ